MFLTYLFKYSLSPTQYEMFNYVRTKHTITFIIWVTWTNYNEVLHAFVDGFKCQLAFRLSGLRQLNYD